MTVKIHDFLIQATKQDHYRRFHDHGQSIFIAMIVTKNIFKIIKIEDHVEWNQAFNFWKYGTWTCRFDFCCCFYSQHRFIYFKDAQDRIDISFSANQSTSLQNQCEIEFEFLANILEFKSVKSPKEELDMNYNPFGDTPDDVIIT